MNGDCSERLPQECECHQDGESGILESSSAFAQRVLEEIEDFAGTTTCKSVQLVRLKKWAQEQGCWFDDRSQFGDFFDRGSENEVYLSPDQKEIIKLNDFRYSDDNLTSFFDRIKAHNRYFPDWKNSGRFSLIHFLKNKTGNGSRLTTSVFCVDFEINQQRNSIVTGCVRTWYLTYYVAFFKSFPDIFHAVSGKSEIVPSLTGQSEKVPSLTGLLEISDIYGMLKPIRPLKLSWTHYSIILQDANLNARHWYEEEAARETLRSKEHKSEL